MEICKRYTVVSELADAAQGMHEANHALCRRPRFCLCEDEHDFVLLIPLTVFHPSYRRIFLCCRNYNILLHVLYRLNLYPFGFFL